MKTELSLTAVIIATLLILFSSTAYRLHVNRKEAADRSKADYQRGYQFGRNAWHASRTDAPGADDWPSGTIVSNWTAGGLFRYANGVWREIGGDRAYRSVFQNLMTNANPNGGWRFTNVGISTHATGPGFQTYTVKTPVWETEHAIEVLVNHEPNCTLVRYLKDGLTNEFHAWAVPVVISTNFSQQQDIYSGERFGKSGQSSRTTVTKEPESATPPPRP